MTDRIRHCEKLLFFACLDEVNGNSFVWNLQTKHISELYVCKFCKILKAVKYREIILNEGLLNSDVF